MAEKELKLKLEGLREDIREPLSFFAEQLCEALRVKLKSITVVGSSLRKDFRPGKSDINTVVVLTELDHESLNKIAGMAKVMKRKMLSAPLLMTQEYIERSADVFGIEFLNFQLTHETIFGEDAFAEVKITKEDVRLECERELKASLIRLRQGYISSAANRKLVRDVLVSAGKGLAPLLRAMLWLKGVEMPRDEEGTFRKAKEELEINTDSLIEVSRWRVEKVSLTQEQVESSFKAVYKSIDKLAVLIDKLEV